MKRFAHFLAPKALSERVLIAFARPSPPASFVSDAFPDGRRFAVAALISLTNHWYCQQGGQFSTSFQSRAKRCASAIWSMVILVDVKSRALMASTSPLAAANLNHMYASM